ncbi:MAG TPA: L-seryl-tRNA(Sec) selenium transferase [Blastocatellia bacterium]|nr:L-seryl-tRNA(Sec) selenium transferase [Blastocatellia bacterium]
MSNELLRSLPSIERLLTRPVAKRLSADLGRDRARDLLREIIEEVRVEIYAAETKAVTARRVLHTPQSLVDEIERRLEERAKVSGRPSLRRVINATGVIIHTNLGRAPLARAAVEALADIASHYSNLEYDLGRGERGHRESHCQQLIARLAGSEDAILANNNAAAVMLVLNTLAEGGEVIVSRGELIEIGGSFRIPEVMEKSGARLREVGTTNRTRIQDYERAINERTRLILRVHPSNYRIIGFTERPSVEEVAGLSRRAGIASFEDLGSGCLIDLAPHGVKDEPVVKESINAGITVVSFSGDKMLGGPQAGIIAGSREIVDRVRNNPLMRALRADKMTYIALEATLRLYERDVAGREIPVIRAIMATREEIAERAARLSEAIERSTRGRFKASLEVGNSVIGGGSAPQVAIETVLVALRDNEMSAASIEERLRGHRVPVITRTERGSVMIDLRTVAEDEEPIIIEAIAALAQPAPRSMASVEG